MTLKEHSWSKIDSFVGNHTHAALLNYRPCPICESLHLPRSLLIFDDFQFYTDSDVEPKRAKIQEVQCQECHGVYLNPCYSRTGFSYLFAEASQSYGSTEGRIQEQIDWLFSRHLLDEGGVFLDVGCYEGKFLSSLPKSIRRIGLDIDAQAIARGREHYGADGIELIHGLFETFQCPALPDVISMFHVLEHLANPFEALAHLWKISHSETRLIIEVPVLEYGRTNDINGFMSVQHMTHFSMHSIGRLMSYAGWEILERQQMLDYNGHRIMAKKGEVSSEVGGSGSDSVELLKYLEHWYQNLKRVSCLIESWPRVARVVIFGGGVHNEFLYQVTQLFTRDATCEYLIVDSDPLKQGKSWRGLSIFSPECLREVDWSDCFLIISSYGAQEDIAQVAANLGVPPAAIKRLYDNVHSY